MYYKKIFLQNTEKKFTAILVEMGRIHTLQDLQAGSRLGTTKEAEQEKMIRELQGYLERVATKLNEAKEEMNKEHSKLVRQTEKTEKLKQELRIQRNDVGSTELKLQLKQVILEKETIAGHCALLSKECALLEQRCRTGEQERDSLQLALEKSLKMDETAIQGAMEIGKAFHQSEDRVPESESEGSEGNEAGGKKTEVIGGKETGETELHPLYPALYGIIQQNLGLIILIIIIAIGWFILRYWPTGRPTHQTSGSYSLYR